MIDTFKKGIYHTYSFDNENTIKMNDSMMDIFSLCRFFVKFGGKFFISLFPS